VVFGWIWCDGYASLLSGFFGLLVALLLISGIGVGGTIQG
jgi:hypothetical protein